MSRKRLQTGLILIRRILGGGSKTVMIGFVMMILFPPLHILGTDRFPHCSHYCSGTSTTMWQSRDTTTNKLMCKVRVKCL